MLWFVQDWLERAKCFYPPDVATDASLPSHLVQMLDKNGMILIAVFIEYMQVAHLYWSRALPTCKQVKYKYIIVQPKASWAGLTL